MKVITEAVLRDELRASRPASYVVPKDKILSPAAREYLQQCKIRIVDERNPEKPRTFFERGVRGEKEVLKGKWVDFETGAFYDEKPEYMTHLYDNQLVAKDHRRIVFRGKLDSLQGLFILNQTILADEMGSDGLMNDLSDLIGGLREMMRCDVLNVPLERPRMIGLTHEELREHSHHPMKFYQVRQMVLPDASLGKVYALLNQLRTQVRETECTAVAAFRDEKGFQREDILEELNRMSSAMHIVMCKYLAGVY